VEPEVLFSVCRIYIGPPQLRGGGFGGGGYSLKSLNCFNASSVFTGENLSKKKNSFIFVDLGLCWLSWTYGFFQWRLVGADSGGTTLKYKIPLVIGLTNCQIKYNKMKHNTHIIILLLF